MTPAWRSSGLSSEREWTAGCGSANQLGSHARFYMLTLEARSTATITTAAQADTVLHLLNGHGRSGASLLSNDDIESGNTNSRISGTLEVGNHTVEVTTYTGGTTGSFTLLLRFQSGDAGQASPQA